MADQQHPAKNDRTKFHQMARRISKREKRLISILIRFFTSSYMSVCHISSKKVRATKNVTKDKIP